MSKLPPKVSPAQNPVITNGAEEILRQLWYTARKIDNALQQSQAPYPKDVAHFRDALAQAEAFMDE